MSNKYKAYNTYAKTFYPIEHFALRADGVWLQLMDAEVNRWEPCQGDMIFLQYTGLKDRKGIEIYRDDILRHKHHPKDYAVIEWLADGWKIRVDTPKGPRWHECYEGQSDDYGSGRLDYYEVIGNTHLHNSTIK